MKTLSRIIALLLVLSLAGCAAVKPGEPSSAGGEWKPVTVKDDLGREVTLETAPERVAVLMGSFAETWLLAGGKLIAAPKDAWEDFELDLDDSVTDLGSYMKISAEALFGLEADLIIASSNTKSQMELKDTLENAGMNVLYFDVNGFEDYLRMLKTCTEITGRADLFETNGTEISLQVEKAKEAAADALNGREAPRVLFVRTAASGIHVKGSDGTVLGLMLRDLGCVNIADGSDLLENLSIEKIIEEDPDRIFIVMQGSD
ncbi:MAG: ABC transporter substrate-binding protein [Clostridiales bacterium]|nr:ABC transporter substrate-binding protein [Clostridiales bacterium]